MSDNPENTSNRNGRVRGGQVRPVRFAVVGCGHIAQNAVLPAFDHADGCELTAIFSEDPEKQRRLARLYGVEEVFEYDDFDDACRDEVFDAVYIALPNSMHAEYTIRAARAGIHVLCEKPMATSVEECAAMIRACRRSDVRLMIAYRLHFEKANLKAMEIARSGRLGELRLFNSVFSMQVKEDNIRTRTELGGGPLFDLGVYCINAARYLFEDEPIDVVAAAAQGDDPRFEEVEEAMSAILRFPGERLATFTCSFGAADSGFYQLIGTEGDLCLDPAYEYEGELTHMLTIGDRTHEQEFPKRDQFAPELIYFADCVRRGIDPEPGGPEGMIDVAIVRAIFESARTGRRVPIRGLPIDETPEPEQEIRRRPVRKRPLVHAESAHEE
jgi:glucose-fructose oxidoreductase